MLGQRYEILQLLGQGGMGAVYKAKDREVERFVALKIISPSLADREEALQRFRQELILARRVVHKNVIRTFDLGEADGVKFISMDYIEGQDLKKLLNKKGRFPPEEAVSIILRICQALDAAHAEGVIHRDLKPQNIMLDDQGKVTVMDFGIARSMEAPGMTQTGALLGTPEYMSPEQVKGQELDPRSDLFTLGIIFYELLTAKTPYRADTALATMVKRTQERARPPIELDPAIPHFLSEVALKCLEIDRERRYQTAAELIKDLEAWKEGRTPWVMRKFKRFGVTALGWPRLRQIAGATLLLVFVLAVVFRHRIFPPPPQKAASVQVISLAILPFRNASADPALDWLGPSLTEMLRTDVGQSPSLHIVSSDRVFQILHDLRMSPGSNFDSDTLRRVAEFTSADRLLKGEYVKMGEQIRIDATLEDIKQQSSVRLKREAPNEKDLLHTVEELAKSIQQNLALAPDVLKELQAKSLKPSSTSLQALREYNEGLNLARQGNNLQAEKHFEAATQGDPLFALAYSKLAQTYASLGYGDKAEQSSRKAVELSEKLTPQERYLIQANHAQIMHDHVKAIESYENLAKVSQDDLDVQFTLAGLYEARGMFDQSLKHYAQVVERDPKHVDALLSIGRVEIKRGNPQGALEGLNRALIFSVQLENEEEKAAILQAIGVAYKKLNKLDEALRNYQQSLDVKQHLGQQRGIATSLNEIAQIQALLGHQDAALSGYTKALEIRREIGDQKGVGDTLIDLGHFYNERGHYDQALKLFNESLQIQRDLGNETYQALCLNDIGNAYLSMDDYENARAYFGQALQLREKFNVPGPLAETLHNLAETSTRIGEYEQAETYYLHALELRRRVPDNRGAAIESYRMGALFEFQGRYGAALSSKEEALKTFRTLGDRSFWMAEILSGYGHSLSQVGRYDEAEKAFDEALSLAREVKNPTLIAEALDFKGDSLFYRGKLDSARALFEQALQEASQTTDRRLMLLSKLNLAKVAVKERRVQAALTTLKPLAQQADVLGLKSVSVECGAYLAEARIEAREYSAARTELEAIIRKSKALRLRALVAQSDYLLGRTLQLTGSSAEAMRHFTDARRMLEDIRNEARTDALLKRFDLSPISSAP